MAKCTNSEFGVILGLFWERTGVGSAFIDMYNVIVSSNKSIAS
jgi:hypothetical protein